MDRLATSAVQRLIARMTREAVRAFQQHGNADAGLSWYVHELHALVRKGMIAGHLIGQDRARATVRTHLRDRPKRLDRTPYDVAIEFLRMRAQLLPLDMELLRQAYDANSLAAATEFTHAVGERLAETMQAVTTQGLHVRAGTRLLQERLKIAKPLAETLFRTQHQLAYSAGRLSINADPDIDEIIWGYEYTAVMDSRVRESHAALNGIRLPKDHPRWSEIMPPNGYNCRCDVIEIFVDDPEAEREEKPPADVAVVDGITVRPGADEGFAFNPGEMFAEMKMLV